MPERFMDFDLAAEIVNEVEARVGKVGEKSVNTNKPGEKLNSVTLSRGGIVTPLHTLWQNREARRREHVYGEGSDKVGQLRYPDAPEPTQPVYHPELAIVRHSVGEDGPEGVEAGDRGVALSRDDSRHYVFAQGDDGLWRAYDASMNSSDNYWTQTTEYFLDTSRPVELNEEGFAIQGLITAFDEALVARAANAVDRQTGLIPQGQ